MSEKRDPILDRMPLDAELIVARYARAATSSQKKARKMLAAWRKLSPSEQNETYWRMKLELADEKTEDILRRPSVAPVVDIKGPEDGGGAA